MRTKRGIDGLVYGQAKLTVKSEELLELLNLLLKLGESYKNITVDQDSAWVELAYPSALRVREACLEQNICAEVSLFYGLPYWILGLLRRTGLVVGIIAAIAIISIGNSVLWDIRIEGNTGLSDSEVRQVLAEHGIHPGVICNKLDLGEIQAEIELASEEIAWISVNIIGTVAYVEVIEERIPPAQSPPEGDGVNLIAERDGVVVGFEIIAGEPIAVTGQTVRKGELLVGGLVDSERFGYRALEAKGKVFAVTERSFEIEIPYEYAVRIPEKQEICEISLIFFSFRQKVFKKGGFLGSEYDTIYTDKYIYSSKGATIPVGISLAKRPIYAESVVKRTREEAVDLAYLEINRMLLAALPDAEILSKSFSGGDSPDGTAYRLICQVSCIDDIAKPVPFYINQ